MRKIGKKQGKEQSRQLGFPVRGLARESSFDAVILSWFGLGTEMSESAVKGEKYVRGGGYTTVGVAAGEESGTSCNCRGQASSLSRSQRRSQLSPHSSVKELMEPRGVWSYSSYSIACDTGRLRRSRCKNMNVGTISSISSDNIR
jgi:hypothetical protein